MFTNGTLFGVYDGQSTGNTTNNAWNVCNTTDPNLQPNNDIFQILAPGGGCLLRVNSAGVVTTNLTSGYTTSTVVAAYQMTSAQYQSLPATPTAAQICNAAFPLNYQNQMLDLIQVNTQVPTSNTPGGNGPIWRLLYNGSTSLT